MQIAVMYPGTFDPITRGHEQLIRRCVRIFDRVVVAVAESPKKVPMFSLSERVALARAVLGDLPQVSVTGYDGLTVDFARREGLVAIIRGLRAASDFEYEFQLAGMNRRLAPEVETVFMTPSEQEMFISASLVKEIALLGGNVSDFVDARVAAAMAAKIR